MLRTSIILIVVFSMAVSTVHAGSCSGSLGNMWALHADGSIEDYFSLGEDVYLGGQNFNNNTEYYYELLDIPDNKSVETSGTVWTDANGDIIVEQIWTIPIDDYVPHEYRIDTYYYIEECGEKIFTKKDSFFTKEDFFDPTIIYVPDDYPTIQAAVDAANAGDTIIVRDGTYTENVVVSKSLSIQSESGAGTTVVQAATNTDVIRVTADNVNISGLTLKDSASFSGINFLWADYGSIVDNIVVNNEGGIYLYASNNNTVRGNEVSDNYIGVWLQGHSALDKTHNNSITDNAVDSNDRYGIYLSDATSNIISGNRVSNTKRDPYFSEYYGGIALGYSNNNTITMNILDSNERGVFLYWNSNGNQIYLNNFIDNGNNAYSYSSTNLWNSPEPITYTYSGSTYTNYLGNYWSDYSGSDTDGDGSGDSSYGIGSDRDSYPLMEGFENYGTGSALPENTPPPMAKPNNILPDDGATDVSLTPQFLSSPPLQDVDEESIPWEEIDGIKFTRVYYHIQVSTAPGDYSTSVYSFTDSWLIDQLFGFPSGPKSPYVSSGVLDYGTTYYWRIRYKDFRDVWSPWSEETSFTTRIIADAGEDRSVSSGELVTFDGSDSSGRIASYKWDFDDGTILEGSGKPDKVPHRFRGTMDNSKDYTVKLTIEDDKGNIDSDTASVTVEPLKKTIKVTPPPQPIPTGAFATMTAYYNWVGVAVDTGDDIYVISKIHVEAQGYISYLLSIWDEYTISKGTPAWSEPVFGFWRPVEKNFDYPFGTYRDRTFTFGNGDYTEYFEGLAVGSDDIMRLWAFSVMGEGGAFGPTQDGASASFEPSSIEEPIIAEAPPDLSFADLGSPGELRVYDSQGRVTGLVDGEVKEEIPYSQYDNETESFIVFFPSYPYRYEVAGTEEGTYGLTLISLEEGNATTFTATDIPMSPNATHQYSINWTALSLGEEGVTVQVDSDSDGTFEQTITSDGELSQDEFILQTETTIDIDPDTLNLKSHKMMHHGKWITAYIELPEGYNVSLIDANTVELTYNGTVIPAVNDTKYGFVTRPDSYTTDNDEDGILERMVKFDRAAVIDQVKAQNLTLPADIELTVTGKVFHNSGDADFEGSDTIRVIEKGRHRNKK